MPSATAPEHPEPLDRSSVDPVASDARAGGNTDREQFAQHHQHDPSRDYGGPTPRIGGHGDSIAGHWIAHMIVRATGYDDTPIPPQFVTCEWLLDHAASEGLRGVEADPPLSACGRHFVELE